MNISIEQRLALTMEAHSSRMFLSQGLRMLPGIGEEDLRAPLLQMLALGFEKLFKLTACLMVFERTRSLPTEKEMKAVGHSLIRGRDAVCDGMQAHLGYLDPPALGDDLAFLKSDPLLEAALGALTEWGSQGRYRDLTILVTGGARTGDPMEKWHAVEQSLLRQDPDWLDQIKENRWEQSLARHETAMIQRVIRACIRTWTLGPGGDLAKMNSPMFSPWLGRMDDELDQPAV